MMRLHKYPAELAEKNIKSAYAAGAVKTVHNKGGAILTEIVCTINLSLIVGGYQFATIFMPSAAEESQIVSVPYRIFSAIFCILAILMGMRAGWPRRRGGGKIAAILVCSALYLARVLGDFYFDPPQNSATEIKALYFVVYSMLCVLFAYICFDQIRSRVAAMLALGLLSASVAPSVIKGTLGIGVGAFDSIYRDSTGRMDGNVGLFTISFGYAGASLCLIATQLLSSVARRSILRVFALSVVACLGIAALILSGSRSPFVAGAAVMSIWIISRAKDRAIVLPIMAMVVLLYVGLRGFDFGGVSLQSDATRSRLLEALEYKENSGRLDLVKAGVQHWRDHPFFGASTRTLDTDSVIGFHSAIVDGFAFLGMFAGSAVLFICLLGVLLPIGILIKFPNKDRDWVSLMCLLYTLYNVFFGSGFYLKYEWATLLSLVVVIWADRRGVGVPPSVRKGSVDSGYLPGGSKQRSMLSCCKNL